MLLIDKNIISISHEDYLSENTREGKKVKAYLNADIL